MEYEDSLLCQQESATGTSILEKFNDHPQYVNNNLPPFLLSLNIFIRNKTWDYSSCHQIACFKAMEGLHPPPPSRYRAALSQQYSVASFVTLRILNCLHWSGLRCSCCNVVWFGCDLEAYNLLTASTVRLHVNITLRFCVRWSPYERPIASLVSLTTCFCFFLN
jgi:hypothetical protein